MKLQLFIFSEEQSSEDIIDILTDSVGGINLVMELGFPKSASLMQDYKDKSLNPSADKLQQSKITEKAIALVFGKDCPAFLAMELGQYYMYWPFIEKVISFESNDKFIVCDSFQQGFEPQEAFLSKIKKVELESTNKEEGLIQITFCYANDPKEVQEKVLGNTKGKYLFIFHQKIRPDQYTQAKFEINDGIRDVCYKQNFGSKFIITTTLESHLNYLIGACWRINIFGRLNVCVE